MNSLSPGVGSQAPSQLGSYIPVSDVIPEVVRVVHVIVLDAANLLLARLDVVALAAGRMVDEHVG